MNVLLGSFILERRKELGLSQKDIADYLNVSIPTVYLWEKNERLPDLSLLGLLSSLLKVDLDSLINCKPNLENNFDNVNHFDINQFAKHFNYLRKLNNHSLSSLAELLNIRYQKISKWENCESLPNINELKQCAKIFNVSIAELYYGRILTNEIVNEDKSINEIIVEKTTKTQLNMNIIFIISFIIVFIILFILFKTDNNNDKNNFSSPSFVSSPISNTTSSSNDNISSTMTSSSISSTSSNSSSNSISSISTSSSSTFVVDENYKNLGGDAVLNELLVSSNTIVVYVDYTSYPQGFTVSLYDEDVLLGSSNENAVMFTKLESNKKYTLIITFNHNVNLVYEKDITTL